MADSGAPVTSSSLPTFWLTRAWMLRMLGLMYAVAFLVLIQQGPALIGSDGLLPARDYLERVGAAIGRGPAAFLRLPTLFWLGCSNTALRLGSWAGLALALLVVAGASDAPILAALWLLYMSFIHVGQIFHGYGWEILLLEAGFLAIFLAPPLRPGALRESSPPPTLVFWLFRWLAFRVMFGAGLIKLRGDPCWRNLTCLAFHYETQPIPNPLSWYLHQLPAWFHSLEVLFNHWVELVVPWMAFGPRRVRHVAGAFLVLFQVFLAFSGNLSFLNWLTIAICLSCFDDSALGRLAPARLRDRLATLRGSEGALRRGALIGVALLVAVLSLNPVVNMLSSRQIMNTSFDPFELVNTYGAFGSVGRERYEVILQGTDDVAPGPETRWVDYEFKCKPGDVRRRPCVLSPYHLRIDWQMWFAAMSQARAQPWLIHLVLKLLEGDRAALDLLADGPFRDHPPRFIRAELYRYEFTRYGDSSGNWWKRVRVEEYLGPASLDDPALEAYAAEMGWVR